MARLESLLDRVHDELPAVPKLLALRALSDAAKEFCTRSHAWQEDLDAVSLVPGEKVYELGLDEGVQVAGLKEVRVDGVLSNPFGAEVPRLRTTPVAQGNPQGYVQVTPTVVQLVNAPSQPHTMTLTAALTLRLGATDVDLPDDLVDEYGEQIAAGAKGRLSRMSGQPWFSPEATVGYMALFYSAVTAAKSRAMTSLGDAEMQVEAKTW